MLSTLTLGPLVFGVARNTVMARKTMGPLRPDMQMRYRCVAGNGTPRCWHCEPQQLFAPVEHWPGFFCPGRSCAPVPMLDTVPTTHAECALIPLARFV